MAYDKEYYKEWYKKNTEHLRAKRKAYYEKNKERLRAYQRAYEYRDYWEKRGHHLFSIQDLEAEMPEAPQIKWLKRKLYLPRRKFKKLRQKQLKNKSSKDTDDAA